jgi:hypothetical protein
MLPQLFVSEPTGVKRMDSDEVDPDEVAPADWLSVQQDLRHILLARHNPFHTRSVRFNRSLSVSYLDGRTRRQEMRTLEGADAHCVSLLRVSFSPACWENLD